ncbi:GNAT family N-acetyltransferase [Coralliovum pocilloporae]|uniref:GNAT family N-acetyltransferase n=1 Tax=Coralliovum pocilloporae TaxID=3066369 RepID=UPI003306F04A
MPVPFFQVLNRLPEMPPLQHHDVVLRIPALTDYQDWAALREESRAFLKQWEPTWPSDDLTKPAFRRRIRRYHQDMRCDRAYSFFLFRQSDDRLIGGLSLSNVRRGITQACTLGYWMGKPYAGSGYMTAGVTAALPFVFQTLRLHRLEAACLPYNAASIRLLEKVGFDREGYAKRYLKIDGEWRDHLLFGLISSDESR